MGWLSRREPRDPSQLYGVLQRGTWEEFEAVYRPASVNYEGFSSGTPLTLALRHQDPQTREMIVNRLLDDGADVTARRPLHTLVWGNTHHFESEARLLQRMLDLGADVNATLGNEGTPLEVAASRFKYTDADLEPFYDVLLSRPDIDLLLPSVHGRTVLGNLRAWYSRRAALVERCEALLVERGIPVPGPTNETP